MTDIELLELAAKAAGYETDLSYEYDEDWGFKIVGLKGWWNPLTDDGDALRLAVKLGLDLEVFSDGVRSVVDEGEHGGNMLYVEEFEFFGNDKYAATRRAIVRAAAEIGKTL